METNTASVCAPKVNNESSHFHTHVWIFQVSDMANYSEMKQTKQ